MGVAGDAAGPCARDEPWPGSIPTDRADAAAVRWRPTIADTARGDPFLWQSPDPTFLDAPNLPPLSIASLAGARGLSPRYLNAMPTVSNHHTSSTFAALAIMRIAFHERPVMNTHSRGIQN